MNGISLRYAALLAALSLLGCDGEQYVSPDTALLMVSRDGSGPPILKACNYVPVLLGSQVEKHYPVDGAMEAFVTITRSDIVVTFPGSDEDLPPFHAVPKELEQRPALDESPPTGYTVELGSSCTPDTEP